MMISILDQFEQGNESAHKTASTPKQIVNISQRFL